MVERIHNLEYVPSDGAEAGRKGTLLSENPWPKGSAERLKWNRDYQNAIAGKSLGGVPFVRIPPQHARYPKR